MTRREPWLDPPFRCPPGECMKCGAKLDAGSHPEGLEPEDGDATICAYCGSVLVFAAGAPRMANQDELDEYASHQDLQDALQAVRSSTRNPAFGRWPNGKGPLPPVRSAEAQEADAEAT